MCHGLCVGGVVATMSYCPMDMDDPVWFLNRDTGTEGLVVKGDVEEGQYTFIFIFSA